MKIIFWKKDQQKDQQKEKIPLKERARCWVLYFFGWDLIGGFFIKTYSSWMELAGRDRPIIEGDTFAAACQRHNISDSDLPRIMKNLQTNKRCFVFLGWLSFFLLLFGTSRLLSHGMSLSILNMTLISFLLTGMFFLFSFKYEFRHWQCRNRRLGTLQEFLAAGDFWFILVW